MTLSRQPCTGGGGTPYDGLCGDSGFDYLKEKGTLSFESLKWSKGLTDEFFYGFKTSGKRSIL